MKFTQCQIEAARKWHEAAKNLNDTCSDIAHEINLLRKKYKEAQEEYRKAKGQASCFLPYCGYMEIEIDGKVLKIERCLDDFDIINIPSPEYPF